jgi:hypothetical protein
MDTVYGRYGAILGAWRLPHAVVALQATQRHYYLGWVSEPALIAKYTMNWRYKM